MGSPPSSWEVCTQRPDMLMQRPHGPGPSPLTQTCSTPVRARKLNKVNHLSSTHREWVIEVMKVTEAMRSRRPWSKSWRGRPRALEGRLREEEGTLKTSLGKLVRPISNYKSGKGDEGRIAQWWKLGIHKVLMVPFMTKTNNTRHRDQKVKLGCVPSVCWNKDSSLKITLV